ncbi:hypothetical protein DPEC_G00015660 [Dallia pectoralis]|uniref:Uncharacterized protein n=1 Tax=Dallia pectoralis TaxID=75939 RepID=A0ACC2HMG0_DALPE|nr:hypothetical protein DPEC_G00015660 [Dallia pectoralis]
MFGNRNVPFSYHLSKEDPRSQRSSMTRPSAKTIYKQRKEYSETMNNEPDGFQYRVEHLFTCELDSQEVGSLDDCVARLKKLDSAGKLWGQEMIMEVQGGYLQLNDIETKAELELVPLGSVVQIKAVLNCCAYNSLLTVTVHERNRRHPQVFMFQCEEVGAEHISGDLERAVQVNNNPSHEPRREPVRDQYDIRSGMDNDIGNNFLPIGVPPMMPQERTPPPPRHPAPGYPRNEWEYGKTRPFPENHSSPPVTSQHQNPLPSQVDYGGSEYGAGNLEPPEPQYIETDRNVVIFNHVLSDVELFMGKVTAATTAKEEPNKKNKKSSKKKAPVAENLPHWEEFVSCLQKIKYGFNLLGKLNGQIFNPSAPDFVHIIFSCLASIVSHYPIDLACSVITPLLIEPALILLNQVVTPEEDNLWRALGDSWNMPRSQFPDGHMVPSYNPEFYDGWQPPMPVPPSANQGLSRSNSQHFPSREELMQQRANEGGQLSRNNSQTWSQHEEPVMNSQWNRPLPSREQAMVKMQVIYNFTARNHQELNIMKGEVVQVLDKSGQWWKVRNDRGEEGHVAKNVLGPLDGGEPWDDMRGKQDLRSPPSLNMKSRPADVKAWLEYKGFSKITVRSLSVLSGDLLLGMSKDDLRVVCPEEGSRVFFQLQAIKSSIALASEPYGYGP